MALTFADLEAIIQTHISSDSSGGSNFSLSSSDAAAELSSSAIQNALSASLEDGTLAITGSQYSSSDAQQTVTITGTGSGTPLSGLQLSAVFALDASGQVDLTATAVASASDESWTFTSGSPVLQGTIFDHAEFSSPQFALSSSSSAAGLSFTGSLPLTGVLAILGDLLGGASGFEMSGQVTMTQGVPNITLAAPITNQTTTVGYFDIPINFGLISLLVQNQATDAQPPYFAHAFAQLSSTITYSHNGTSVSIPISARFDSQSSALSFEADLSSLSQDALEVGLSDFQTFMHNENLSTPHEFPLDPSLTLSVLSFVVNLAPTPELVSVGLAVTQDSAWHVVENVIVIEEINIHFDLLNPLMQTRQVLLSMSGNVYFSSNPAPTDPFILVSMGYPFGDGDFFITGELVGEIDLASAVSHFMPAATNLSTGLMLDELKLYADPAGSSYSLAIGIDLNSNWTLDVGIASLGLIAAGASVTYSKSATPTTTGEIQATITIDQAKFEIDWQVPGDFQFNGTIPQIDLEALANELCGSFMALPKGFPDIVFTDAQIAITISSESGNTSYDLALSTDVNLQGVGDLGRALFELRDSESGFGFVVGFLSPDQWSPASIWSGLQDIFGWLEFNNTALIISSLAQPALPPTNINVSSLPATIQQGVTFCTTIELGSSLGLLAQLFDDLGGLTLVAVFDPEDVTKTTFTASMGGPAAGKGVVSFDGFSLTFVAGTDSITVTALIAGQLTIGGKQGEAADILIVKGNATMVLSPTTPNVSFGLLMTGATKSSGGNPTPGWNNPFGINPNLTVVGVGINVGISADGFKFAIGGSISFSDSTISSDPGNVVLTVIMEIVDGEDPAGFIASLASDAPNGVSLTSLVSEFTELDLSWVPLLDQIRLKTLEFYLVDDPTGFVDPLDPNKVLNPGFTINADVIVFGVEADLDIEVIPDTGIKANGFLSQVISLGNVLTISDETGTKGMNGMIDTTTLTGPSPDGKYLSLSGKVSLFDNVAGASVLAYIQNEVFTFDLNFHVPPIDDFTVTCSINGLDDFAASAQLDFELDKGSVDLVVDGNDLGTLSLPQLDITADFQLSLIKLNFNLQIDASFNYQGSQLNLPFAVTESFSDLASLVETTFTQLASRAWDVFKEVYGDINTLYSSINQNLIAPGIDFGVVMRSYYNQSLQQVVQLFQSINYDVTTVVESLKVGFGVSDEDVAKSMQQANYGLNQIASALAKGLGTSPAAAAQIFYDMGYGANDILNALTGYFGQSGPQAQQIVNNLFGNSTKFCAANAFAQLINAPASDTDALQRLRTDLQNSPAGSKAQWYLQLYNQYSAQVHQLITTSGPVQAHIARDDGQQIWNEIVAAVQTAQSNQPTTMPGADEQDAALDILSVMMQVDNDLGQAINEVMNDIWSYEGMTYEQFLAAAQSPHTSGDLSKRD